jgi:hypothetical protein
MNMKRYLFIFLILFSSPLQGGALDATTVLTNGLSSGSVTKRTDYFVHVAICSAHPEFIRWLVGSSRNASQWNHLVGNAAPAFASNGQYIVTEINDLTYSVPLDGSAFVTFEHGGNVYRAETESAYQRSVTTVGLTFRCYSIPVLTLSSEFFEELASLDGGNGNPGGGTITPPGDYEQDLAGVITLLEHIIAQNNHLFELLGYQNTILEHLTHRNDLPTDYLERISIVGECGAGLLAFMGGMGLFSLFAYGMRFT